MIEQFAVYARPVLDFPFIRRTRRNHALEHATIHVLTERKTRAAMAGRSSDGGFVLIGNVPTEQVEAAAQEALNRLRRGERRLALHPNCGTNLVTAGVLTTLTAYLGLGTTSKRPTGDRLSWTMALMMLALMVSQPLGMTLQKHITTEGDPGDLEIVGVSRRQVRWPFAGSPVTVHRVVTRRG
ncbi:MAG: hypothetical protein OHK0046_11930 [Anaerolineae bacterium]